MIKTKTLPERTLEYREVFIVSRSNWTSSMGESPKEFNTYEEAELECIESATRNPLGYYRIEKFYAGINEG